MNRHAPNDSRVLAFLGGIFGVFAGVLYVFVAVPIFLWSIVRLDPTVVGFSDAVGGSFSWLAAGLPGDVHRLSAFRAYWDVMPPPAVWGVMNAGLLSVLVAGIGVLLVRVDRWRGSRTVGLPSWHPRSRVRSRSWARPRDLRHLRIATPGCPSLRWPSWPPWPSWSSPTAPPSRVLRLARAVSEGADTRAYVGHDQRHSALVPADLEAVGATALEDGLASDWGTAAYMDMLLAALEAIRADCDPEWTAVVSGQDYPLRPLAQFEHHLRRSPHQALLGDLWELDLARERAPERQEFRRRYAYRHYAPPRPVVAGAARALGPLAYRRELPAGLGARLGVRTRHPFGPALRCHVSSDWVTLHRSAVAAVLGFSRASPRAMAHYRRTVIPTESLFATVVANDPGLSVGPAPRLLGFDAGSPHPRTYGAGDVDALLDSGALFARKFDSAADGRVLDLLDARRLTAASRPSASGSARPIRRE